MNDESVFQMVAILLLLSGMAVSFYFRYQARRAGEQAGDEISARREERPVLLGLRSVSGLALWLGSMAYLINPRWMAWSSLPLPAWLRWLGAALGALGVPLLYWVFSSLGRNVTHTTAIRREHSLVTNGPYHWIRHPLYSVGMLNFLGFALLSANAFILVSAAVTFFAIQLRTPYEERHLVEKFGPEYQAYMQRTGRYLPRLSRR